LGHDSESFREQAARLPPNLAGSVCFVGSDPLFY
jgi:hypothetical protein